MGSLAGPFVGRRALVLTLVITLLTSPFVGFQVQSASAEPLPTPVTRVGSVTNYLNNPVTSIEIASPTVTADDVAAGAVMIVHVVARVESSISLANVGICPQQLGWTLAERLDVVHTNESFPQLVQLVFWKVATAPADENTLNRFLVKPTSNCSGSLTESVHLSIANTVYRGLDVNAPISEIVSAFSTAFSTTGTAPESTGTYPAGTVAMRMFASGSSSQSVLGNQALLYSETANEALNSRSVAAVESKLDTAGKFTEASISWQYNSWNVATTVVLAGAADDEPPPAEDNTPPTTTVTNADTLTSGWQRTAVTVELSADDGEGEGDGVKEIVYTATGATEIAEQTILGATAQIPLSNDGTTTLTYFARDNAGNTEDTQSIEIKIDKVAPTITGALLSQPNSAGWHAGDVAIRWTCSDVHSGLAEACPAAGVITGEGSNLSVSASVTDNAGNVAHAQSPDVNIDRTAPTITAAVLSEANAAGWHTGDVTVRWTCSDAHSGLAAECPADGVITGEGSNLSVSASIVDNAGNVAHAQSPVVKIDRTAPTITAAVLSEANAAGWHTGDVSIRWTCSDAHSGLAAECPADSVITGEGTGLSISASVADNAGHSATGTSPTVKIDRTAPLTTAPAVATWNAGDVALEFTATDALSGVSSTWLLVNDNQPAQRSQITITEHGTHTVTYWSVDAAGNAEPSRSLTFSIDRVKPTITAVLLSQPNAAGWYAADVTVRWSCADADSGVVGTCPADALVTGEGRNLTLSATLHDSAGNMAQGTSPSVNIDRTAPVTTAPIVPAWNAGPLELDFTAADSLSGVASTWLSLGDAAATQGSNVNVASHGQHSVAYWSIDVAGNVEAARTLSFGIDGQNPTITASLSTEANEHGWHNAPVTITFTCNDADSGVATCSEAVTVNQNIVNGTVTGEAQDNVGNTVTLPVQINVDQQPPTLSWDLQPAANEFGWHRSVPELTFTCSDAHSGIGHCPEGPMLTAGVQPAFSAESTDRAGNRASVNVVAIRIDMTPPTITASARTADGEPYLPGTWTDQAVTITFHCADALSDIATCPDEIVHEAGSIESISGTAVDRAGNTAQTSFGPVLYEAGEPTITASATTADGRPYVAGTWTTQNVTVTFTCTAGDSPITSCPMPQTLSADGERTVTGTATSQSGATATRDFGPVRIDKTPPTVTAKATMLMGGADYTLGTWANAQVIVHFTCTDAGSGIKTCPSTIIYTASTQATASGVAIDNAGNEATVSLGPIWVDMAPPTVTARGIQSDDFVYISPNWTNKSVKITFTCKDEHSGLASCSPPVELTESSPTVDGYVVQGEGVDNVGHVGKSAPLTVRIDKEPPIFPRKPADIRVVSDGPIRVYWDLPPALDTLSGLRDVRCTRFSGTDFEPGVVTVTCRAQDHAGNESQTSFTVTVVPNAPVYVVVPENIVLNSTSPDGATVEYGVTSEGVTQGSVLACTPPSGSKFPLGTTTVTCQVTFGTEVVATGTFTVTVRDLKVQLADLRTAIESEVPDATARTLLLDSLTRAQQTANVDNWAGLRAELERMMLQLDAMVYFGQLTDAASARYLAVIEGILAVLP